MGVTEFECQLPARDSVPLTLVLTIKSLGVLLGTTLTMEAQVVHIARLVLLQLCEDRQLAPFPSSSDLATAITSTVASGLDYCNLLYT